jgi:hypothetical protein
LAILLLAVNLVLAPHNPYQEKDRQTLTYINVDTAKAVAFVQNNLVNSYLYFNVTKGEYIILWLFVIYTVLFGKQMILSAVVYSGYTFMELVAILTSVVSAVYYLATIKQIFFYKQKQSINIY